ncbi:MFS transporter [Erwinia persicina]|uniref:MFS transporter n=1 Tax=Erwinia persicina TaxID=55211 RepID=UPI00177C3E20|nr:MFS transporter [Erwinia persicina]MBD8165017.1 MFS transporter [Erwinia persicina]MBD8216552.1 MFS transporter [Erwinia persicina]
MTNPSSLYRLQAGICLASFLGCIDFTIVNTALPALQRQFTVGPGSVQWAMTLFVMALCCCMVLTARLAERFGQRQMLYAGMLVFGLASLGAGLSSGLMMLNLLRLLQGAGCAVLYTVTAAILVEAVPRERRGRALGLLFAANGLGLAVGPVAGGWLMSVSGWRSIFLINVPLILLSFTLCLGLIPSAPPSPRPRVDYRGWLLMVAGLVPLLVWSGYVTRWGWSAFVSLATLGTAILFLLVFVRVERRTVQPLIDFSVLGSGAFCRACALSVLLAIFYCVAFMMIPFRLVERFGLSDAQLGLMLLPVTLVMALISPLSGRLGDRYGPWRVMTAGFFLLACSALLQSASGSTLSLSRIALAGVMMGAGWGAILGPSVTAALDALPQSQHGQGIGIAWTLHNLGGALGLAVATRMYQSGGAVYGYQWVMWLLVLLSCVGGAVALYSVRRASRRQLAREDN